MSDNKNEIIEEINNFIGIFQENPYSFLYERDIQGYLFSKIFDLYERKHKKILFTSKYEQGDILLNPVKCEYPCKSLFDIAILEALKILKKKIDFLIMMFFGINILTLQLKLNIINKERILITNV